MTESKVSLKICRSCNTVKPLEKNFYRAGSYYQKLCKPCHNASRKKWKQKYTYVKKPPKPNGFKKLPIGVREKILYDISVRYNYKEIAKRHSIKYTTLLNWKRKGLIKKD